MLKVYVTCLIGDFATFDHCCKDVYCSVRLRREILRRPLKQSFRSQGLVTVGRTEVGIVRPHAYEHACVTRNVLHITQRCPDFVHATWYLAARKHTLVLQEQIICKGILSGRVKTKWPEVEQNFSSYSGLCRKNHLPTKTIKLAYESSSHFFIQSINSCQDNDA